MPRERPHKGLRAQSGFREGHHRLVLSGMGLMPQLALSTQAILPPTSDLQVGSETGRDPGHRVGLSE